MLCCSERMSVVATNGVVFEATVNTIESGIGALDQMDFPVNVVVTVNKGEVVSMLCIQLTDMY